MASVPALGAIPRRLAIDAFWSLFGRLEHEQLDFKRGVPDDVRDTIAAMAMTHGGLQLVRRSGVGPGPGPSAAREECSGPLAETVDCCLRFIDRHTRRVEAVAGLRRETLPEYPRAALREAVVRWSRASWSRRFSRRPPAP